MTQNDIPNNQNALEPLPEMETYEQAEAVSKERGDHFYLCAFMMKSWVEGLMTEAYVRLAPENQHPEGFLQTGRAWKGFLDIFGKLNEVQFHNSIRAVRRFITYDDPWAGLLLRAQTALVIEQELNGDHVRLRSLPAGKQPMEAVRLLRHFAERWCDWLDATVHLETYGQGKLLRDRPDSSFEPELTAFGHRMCRLPTPEGTTEDDLRSKSEDWPEREIDTLLIVLQPLAKQHHWSCIELLTIIRQLVSDPQAYPCWSTSDLADYRRKALALPPITAVYQPQDGIPAGLKAALAICPPLQFEQPLWS